MAHPALLDELRREQSIWSQTANRMKNRSNAPGCPR